MGASTVEQFQNDRIVELAVAGLSARAIARELGGGIAHSTVARRLRQHELERRVEEGLREARRAESKERDRKRRAEAERQRRLGRKAQELANPSPTPPPVPRPSVVKGSVEEQILQRLEGQTQRPEATGARRRRRRSPVRVVSSVGTVFQSPLDTLNRAHARGWVATEAPYAWHDALERQLVARDPSGTRVYRIDPSERAEYEADGFLVS